MGTDYERILMERLRIGVTEAIGPEVANQLELDIEKLMTDRLIYKLTTKVLARAIIRDTRTYSVGHPASWWQHLKFDLIKKRLIPDRIAWRWPVKWNHTEIAVHFKQYETYPRSSTMLPPSRFGYPIIVETASSDIDSKFPVSQDGGLAEDDCMPKSEIVHRILRHASKANASRYSARLVTPTDIYDVLEALEYLGVHTAGLVKRDGER